MTRFFLSLFPVLALAALLALLPPWHTARAGASLTVLQPEPQRLLPPVERLDYILRFGILDVGVATLEMNTDDAREATTNLLKQQIDKYQNLAAYMPGANRHFLLTARSTGLTDLFYTVRKRITALTSVSFDGSHVYEKKSRYGGGYWNYILAFTDKNITRIDIARNGTRLDQATTALSGPHNTLLDPLSALHALRLDAPVPGSAYFKTITDGKTTSSMEAVILGRETITVDAGRFETLKAKILLYGVDGLFRASPQGFFTVWVTEAFPHTPVKIESYLRVGPFEDTLRVELVHAMPELVSLPHTAPASPTSTTD